jgi:hypothetical protein
MIGMRYEDGVIQTNFISRFHHDWQQPSFG